MVNYRYVWPTFLEAFHEVKELIQIWAKNNLDQLSYENVHLKIRTNRIPQVYKIYLEDCNSGNDPLLQEDSLHVFSFFFLNLFPLFGSG